MGGFTAVVEIGMVVVDTGGRSCTGVIADATLALDSKDFVL